MAEPSTTGIQDYMSYADVTERIKELKELLQMIPGFDASDTAKQAWIQNVMLKITMIPDAPTRTGMGREMAEMEKIRDEMKMLATKLYAMHGKLEARTEMEKAESGLELSENSET